MLQSVAIKLGVILKFSPGLVHKPNLSKTTNSFD
jgi:hypothetical protein